MNIDIECIALLSLILQDSPKDRQLILCILARFNTGPLKIAFNPNTDYPTFYGYSNIRTTYYLMDKGVLSNVPREGYSKRLISSHYLSYTEAIINKAKNWDIQQKLTSISKFITLDNKTAYKDAELFLIFRDEALEYIKSYATSHEDEISSFLGVELSEVFKTINNENKIEKVENEMVGADFKPIGWELAKDDTKAYLRKEGLVAFTFPTNWSRRFKYFEYMWDHPGQKVDYKSAYEYATGLDYPSQKGIIWKINKSLRNEVDKLRKKLQSSNLPIKIVTARGLTLTISE